MVLSLRFKPKAMAMVQSYQHIHVFLRNIAALIMGCLNGISFSKCAASDAR